MGGFFEVLVWSVVLGLSCELLSGCLTPDSRSDLSSASKSMGARPCASMEGQNVPIHISRKQRCCMGLLRATDHA